MKLGFVGLGKLGLPIAVACDLRGHDVMGTDIDAARMSKSPQPYREAGPEGEGDFNVWLGNSSLRFGSLAEVCHHAEIIFICVQTPHHPEFEGITPLPDERRDFDYTYLSGAIGAIAAYVSRETIVAVVSTTLPGTFDRLLLPLFNEHMRPAYAPAFIAMGTTMRDFLQPEFVLHGFESIQGTGPLYRFFKSITDAPMIPCSVVEAETIKVLYNTFISQKIAFGNVLGELCRKVGADADVVLNALGQGGRRIVSMAYMRPGMGDSGPCHPRDNIALSWLARKLGLHFDLFESVMRARQAHAEALAHALHYHSWADENGKTRPEPLPMMIFGYAYKAESAIVTGSHALLVYSILRLQGHNVELRDPVVERVNDPGRAALQVFIGPVAVLIGCNHAEMKRVSFEIRASGSVVIDPWGDFGLRVGVRVVRLGDSPPPPAVHEVKHMDGLGFAAS